MLEKLQRYRGYIFLTLIYTIFFGSYVFYEHRPQPEPLQIIEPTLPLTPTPAPLQVHVAGAVRQPGVYSLPPGSRLLQAVEAAGGLTAEADEESLNLADYVQDGHRVYIPKRGTPAPPSPTAEAEPASMEGTESSGGLVNINTASAEALDTLPGIGPALAERIIAYRQEHGPFTDIGQIMEVKGIGEATFARLKAYITIR
jgi:competence protein ComEA